MYIVLLGNCQIEGLRYFINLYTNNSHDIYTISYAQLKVHSSEIDTMLEKCDMCISQHFYAGIYYYNDDIIKHTLNCNTPIIYIHNLYFTGYFPDNKISKIVQFNKNNNYFFPPYVLETPYLFHLISQPEKLSVSKILEELNCAFKMEKIILHSEESFNNLLMREKGNNNFKKITIPIVDYITQYYKTIRLFHTENHPCNLLLNVYAYRIAKYICNGNCIDYTNTYSTNISEFLGNTQSPIYGNTINALSLCFDNNLTKIKGIEYNLTNYINMIKNISSRIFVIGANGMLGRYIISFLSSMKLQVHSIVRTDYDISNLSFESLNELFINKSISSNDVIINCAGIIPQSTNPSKTNIRAYFTINSIFPVMLGVICEKYNARFIHITTDCVFSGKENGNYTEQSLHTELNEYGTSKSLGELCCSATIIRTSIIGEEIANKHSLLEWVKKNAGKNINGYKNHWWNGVTCLELSKIIYNIIVKDLFWNGVRHIFSPTCVNKYELIKMINDIYDLNANITAINMNENIDKTLSTIYNENSLFQIQEIEKQIAELKNYKIQ